MTVEIPGRAREGNHKWTFRLPCWLPSFGRTFMQTDPRIVSDVSRMRNDKEWDKPAVPKRYVERPALSGANIHRCLIGIYEWQKVAERRMSGLGRKQGDSCSSHGVASRPMQDTKCRIGQTGCFHLSGSVEGTVFERDMSGTAAIRESGNISSRARRRRNGDKRAAHFSTVLMEMGSCSA